MMKKDLRIVFMGTPDFAVESLKKLYEAKKNIVGVITAPDKKAGRGQQLSQSAVKTYALEKGLTVLQPTNLKADHFLKELEDLKADLQIVVAFRMLPEVVWNKPPLGTFNLHGSLLPLYRGAAPINWAIINGEKETGVSTFFLKHQIDTGDIILQQSCPINDRDNAGDIHDRLMQIGANLVLQTVELIESNEVETQVQDINGIEQKRLEAPKIFREDCQMDWGKDMNALDAFIRGLSPYPGAWTTIRHKDSEKEFQLKIFRSEISDYKDHKELKIIQEGKRLFIQAQNGSLELFEVQLQGKRKMTAQELCNGFNFEEYELV